MSDQTPFNVREALDRLPEQPGVYRMLDAQGVVLYVGKAKSLKKRVSSYFQKNLASPRIALMVSRIAGIDTTVTRSEAEALLLENNLIKRLLPQFNILFRDDKSYPYIQLTKSEFPQLAFFRGTPGRKGDYFGPYPSTTAVRASLGVLQKTFRLRTCTDSVFNNRSRACLLYQIKRCSGPCVGHIDTVAYAADVQLAKMFLDGRGSEVMKQLSARMEEFAEQLAFEQAAIIRDQLTMFGKLRDRQFVTGAGCEEADIIVGTRHEGALCINLAMIRSGEHLGDKPMFPQHAEHWEISEALGDFLRHHYANHRLPARIICNTKIADEVINDLAVIASRDISIALPRGDAQRAWVSMAEKNAVIATMAQSSASAVLLRELDALQECLGMDERPQRIECFDISHTQGEATVGSCVVCVSGTMKHNEYRRFNIQGVTAGDDMRAIAQVVRRRYAKLAESLLLEGNLSAAPEFPRPDLIIIDGGQGQVDFAMATLEELGIANEIPVIGISKGEGRKEGLEKIVFGNRRLPLQLKLDQPGFRLLLEIRNEAHRFAISGHRLKRAKPRRESLLDGVSGIGPKRRKTLLAHFGSLSGVRDATVEQITSVPGFNQKLAQLIYQTLR